MHLESTNQNSRVNIGHVLQFMDKSAFHFTGISAYRMNGNSPFKFQIYTFFKLFNIFASRSM